VSTAVDLQLLPFLLMTQSVVFDFESEDTRHMEAMLEAPTNQPEIKPVKPVFFARTQTRVYGFENGRVTRIFERPSRLTAE